MNIVQLSMSIYGNKEKKKKEEKRKKNTKEDFVFNFGIPKKLWETFFSFWHRNTRANQKKKKESETWWRSREMLIEDQKGVKGRSDFMKTKKKKMKEEKEEESHYRRKSINISYMHIAPRLTRYCM